MKRWHLLELFVLLIGFIGVYGCKQVKTNAPVQEAFEPAIPDPVSLVAGNLTFNISDLEEKINQSLSTTLVHEDTFEGNAGEAWKLWVERTGPVRIRYENRRVYFSAPLQVWYSNPINLHKRENRKSRPLCALAVNFNSPVGVGPSWQLVTKSTFENYHWTQEPKVKLLGIKIGVKKIAETVLDKRRADIEHAIDIAVHDAVHLDKEVRKVWRDLQKPLRIAKQPENVWLLPKPFSVAAAPVFGNSHQITVPLQIAFRVATKLGPEPVVDTLERLPRLQQRGHLPEAARLSVLAFIPYQDVNNVLDRTLSKEKMNLAGGNLTIKKATVYGNGRRLVVKIDVTGAVKGLLYLHGQPVYDTLQNTLRVDNVDFEVDTKEKLMASADWLLHDNLRDTLQSVLVVPLRREIASIPGKIEAAFARAKVSEKTDLDIESFQLVPQRIVVRPDGVQILIKVRSKVAVKLKEL